MSRIDSIRARVQEHGAGSALISHLPHVQWATGFTGSNALLWVAPDQATLFTDGRYTSQAATETGGCCEIVIAPDVVQALADNVSATTPTAATSAILFEAESMTVARHAKVADALDADLVATTGLLHVDVASKEADQVEALRRSQAVTCDVFEVIVPLIAPGVSELDLAAEIVYQHLRRGASAMSFEPIVASGPRGALPHARPSARTFVPGDMIVIDMGGVVDGYCADLTRTVAVGPPSAAVRAAYDAVEAALVASLDVARADVLGGDMDRAARAVLQRAGLADYFTHSLGHGVGLEVHEWPRLSGQVEHRIPLNACVTVEPGVYVPDAFGIRTEDLIVVREDGAESLTPLSRELVVV